MGAKASIKLVCVIGCHCIITRECIGSHTAIKKLKQEPAITKLACTVLPWIDCLAQFLSEADLRARNKIRTPEGRAQERALTDLAAFQA